MRGYKETPERIFVANPCDASPTAAQFAGYEGMSVQICRGKKPWPRDAKFSSAADVEAFARSVGMIDDVRERFYGIYCDQKHVPQGYRLVGAGGVAEALVDPKILFQPAVALATPVLFCVHNHPSGDFKPSLEDQRLLQRLDLAAKVVGVRIVDFCVAAVNGIYSFAEHDQMPVK